MDNDPDNETVTPAQDQAGDEEGGDWYARRRRRLTLVAWAVVGCFFLVTAFGLSDALWGTRARLLFPGSFSVPRYPGDTERMVHVWGLSRGHDYADALEESEAIAQDPDAAPEERFTAQAEVADDAWRLGETDVATSALADFEKRSPGVKINPAVLDEARQVKRLLDSHYLAKYLNPISGNYWANAKPKLQNGTFAAGLAGWETSRNGGDGKYTADTDPNGFGAGFASAYLAADDAGDQDWNSLGSAVSAADYLGKRVQITAWMKTDNVSRHAYFWMRVDTPEVNYFARAPKPALVGSTDWQQQSVVLDIPPDAQGIALGEVLAGNGKASLANVHLSVVGGNVPTTPARSDFGS